MQAAPQVQWKTLDDLEVSLREFQRRYAEERSVRRELRDVVIRTKDRARFASRNPKVSEEKRAAKEEMVQWMLVWLDDPAIFGDWVTLRRAKLGTD
jgi:predicted aminopeptidase